MRVKRLAWIALALLVSPVLAWGLVAAWPGAPPGQGYGPQTRRVIFAQGGAGQGGVPLASLSNPQLRAGPWLGAKEIPPLVAAAAQAAEDRRFLAHAGVDPWALVGAVWANLRANRVVRGGSTITMQVARLEHPSRRTVGAKLREVARALWLEARLSKQEILAQYLNRAPFGGPLVGLGAASQALLGKSPQRLSPAEAALLLALPQDPSRLLRQDQRPRLTARRDAILTAMARAGVLMPAELERALGAPVVLDPLPPPALEAPHFVQALAARLPPDAPATVETYIEPGLQHDLASLVRTACQGRRQLGLRQAAALVLRNRDRAVLAWVGSPDFREPEAGQVDGVLALNQPGSVLKPFLYSLALERGYTLATMLKDEPLALPMQGGAAFRPADYDRLHRGPVSLRVALASSLNLPALRLAQELGPPAVLARLRELGLSLPQAAEHYGLGLALGDGEVSLLALTQAYATLAGGGVWAPARLWRGQPGERPSPVIDPHAAALVTAALNDDRARSLGFGREGVLALPFPAAVKTGTSQHHRDNWCLGYTADYTVGVWAGNFEGQPMRGVSGVSGAAPLWRQVMLLLHRDHPGNLPADPELRRLWACPESGLLASAACPAREEEMFAPSAPPPGQCNLHGLLATSASASPPRLTLLAPVVEGVYALDPDVDPSLQVLTCRAQVQGQINQAAWRLDGLELASSGEPLRARVRLTPGRHRLEVKAWGPGGEDALEAAFTVVGRATP
jgi:penicillin-binding protein 1C